MSDVRVSGGKLQLKPKKHHGYSLLLFILGTLLPPLAVAARFGIGKDFWVNVLCTLCGYLPGHGHNFYIQNIRNNYNNARTPKWAAKYGLVDTTAMDRKKKKSEWAKRYGDRLPRSVLENQDYEDGQIPDRDVENERSGHGRNEAHEFWREDEESFYGNGTRSNNRSGDGESGVSIQSDENSSGRWSYPANFNDAVVDGSSRRKKKKSKKDRWARTEEAYATTEDTGVQKRKKKQKKKVSSEAESLPAGPAVYGDNPSLDSTEQSATNDSARGDEFNHQF